jgi:hypothetical protein
LSAIALMICLPMRPNPLIPTRIAIVISTIKEFLVPATYRSQQQYEIRQKW